MVFPELRGGIFAVSTAMLALTGAGSFRGLPAQQGGAAAATESAAWLPLLEGTTWTYDTVLEQQGEPQVRGVFADLVWGELTMGEPGRFTQILRRWGPDGKAPRYVRHTEQGLVEHRDRLIAPGHGGPSGEVQQRLLATPVGVEREWRWQTTVGCQTAVMEGQAPPPREFEVEQHVGRLLGTDVQVVVPAGTFLCVHVRLESDWPTVGSSAEELWFARGVGIVRSVKTEPRGARTTAELRTFRLGRAVVREPRAQLLRCLDAQYGSRTDLDIAWPEMERFAFELHGRIAVVRVGDADERQCYWVDEQVTPFAVDDRAFWLARMREIYGAWPDELMPRPLAAADRELSMYELTQLLSRTEALRRGRVFDEHPRMDIKRRKSPDGVAELAGAARMAWRASDGSRATATARLVLSGDQVTKVEVVETPVTK